MQNQTISVLITKRTDRFSKLIYWLTGRKYTHASIRLDGMGESFYSFTSKGFCREPFRWLTGRKMVSGVLYRLEVSGEVYVNAETTLKHFLQNRKHYRYSLLGAILCLLHIPCKFKNLYFCSQFVAELLVSSGAVDLKRKASTYLPNTLDRELRECPTLYEAELIPVCA